MIRTVDQWMRLFDLKRKYNPTMTNSGIAAIILTEMKGYGNARANEKNVKPDDVTNLRNALIAYHRWVEQLLKVGDI